MPFGQYKDFASCVLANKSKKSPEGYCAALHKKILGRYPGQSESYSDPLVIDQPKGTKLKFSIQQEVEDPMTDQERKAVLFDIIQCNRQNKPDIFNNLWAELGLEYAESLPSIVEDSSDLSVYLSDIAPKLSSVDLSKIVFRCSTHYNLDIALSENRIIHWETVPTNTAVQYLESGDIKFPVRNKILSNKLGDIIGVESGIISDKSNNTNTIAEGEAALGLSTNDLHEYFLWFASESLKPLSGRWTIKFAEDEWSICKNYLFPAPFILSASAFVNDLNPLLEEGGISCVCFSPELLPILESDDLGKEWLSSISVNKIKEIYSKYIPPVTKSIAIKEVMTPKDWAKAYSGEVPHWATDMNPSKFVQEFIQQLNGYDHPSVLEIGCGNGRDSIFMSQAGFNVYSIDITPKAIELARENAAKVQASVDFRIANAEQLPFPEKTFNGVFTLSVLHSTNLSQSLSEVYRVLDTGGVAFIYIYGNTQSANGALETIILLDDYIKLLHLLKFRIDEFYTEDEKDFDEYGEKHRLFVTRVVKI